MSSDTYGGIPPPGNPRQKGRDPGQLGHIRVFPATGFPDYESVGAGPADLKIDDLPLGWGFHAVPNTLGSASTNKAAWPGWMASMSGQDTSQRPGWEKGF